MMSSVQNSLLIFQISRKKSGDSFSEDDITKIGLQVQSSSTDSSLESNSTNDLDIDSTATQFSRTASTSITSLGDPPIISNKEPDRIDDLHIQKLHTASQNDYLLFIHPNPTQPPSYDELPPGGCPKYPITDRICGNEQLPEYSAAAFKFGICTRKQEFVSPYDISTNRSWKTVAMELNSTQINFYEMSAQLEKTLWSQNSVSLEEMNVHAGGSNSVDCHSSLVTNSHDIELFRICERSGVFNQGLMRHERIAQNDISSDLSQLQPYKNGKHKLIRSYSLQHAKFGLANDYIKKPNVLRLRLENEQLLIHFSSAKELIDWHLAISIGKDVSLDIADREIPKYRTVPRRRRNAIASNLIAWNDIIMRQSRKQSESVSLQDRFGICSSVIGFFKKRSVLTQRSLEGKKPTSESLKNPLSIGPLTQRATNTSTPMEHATRRNSRPQNTDSGKLCTVSSRVGHDHINSGLLSTVSSDQNPNEYSRVSDEIHESEEEYEEYEAESDIENPDTTNLEISRGTDGDKLMDMDPDVSKWDSTYKIESQRRFIRNCLKCIRPLAFDDKWLNKLMVKPTKMTPLISHFNKYFHILDVGVSSSCQMDTKSISAISSRLLMGNGKKNSSALNEVGQTNTSLNRIPCHNLREYVVGSHSLIPRNL